MNKKPSLLLEEKREDVPKESPWELLRYSTWHSKRRKYKHMEKMKNKLTLTNQCQKKRKKEKGHYMVVGEYGGCSHVE